MKRRVAPANLGKGRIDVNESVLQIGPLPRRRMGARVVGNVEFRLAGIDECKR